MSKISRNILIFISLSILISKISCNPTFENHAQDESQDSEFIAHQIIIGVSIFVIVIIGALLICNIGLCSMDALKYICLTAAAFAILAGLIFTIVFIVSSIANEMDN
jgi:hypothetical protein